MLPPGLGPDQSGVCQFAGTQTASLYTHLTHTLRTDGERRRHREEGGGSGRAAEIRKHHSALNRGYVEVRKPQQALLPAHLGKRESSQDPFSKRLQDVFV